MPILVAGAFVAGGVVRAVARADDAPLLLGAGGAALAYLVGWEHLAYLTTALLPTAIPDALARAAVAATLGIGAGLALSLVARAVPTGAPATDTEAVPA